MSRMRIRLVRLTEDLRREGFYEAWVYPDGVCKVKTNQGYLHLSFQKRRAA